MQKLQDSVFSIVKTTNLSPAVFSFLQPSDDFEDKTPLGGILKDTKHGWLALGPKFCVVDLRTGLKVAARTFGASLSNNTSVTCVVELPKPLTKNSQQLVISLQCDDFGMICVLHINGSQILRCIQTDVVVTELAICDRIPDGPFTCFDGLIVAGTKRGEILAFDLNRTSLIEALKHILQGYKHLVRNETNPASLGFLPVNAIQRIEGQREMALENDHHLAILLNEDSLVDGQYIFRNPDFTIRMKAKRDHVRVTVLQYIPQLASVVVGFNFGAFQIWNLMTLDLEFTSQVNVECLPVTHFAFQEPCDDPRAFCYLWVIFSVIDRYEEEEFPLAVMYSLTYHGKRMLSETKHLYQDFSTATIRFQIELSTLEESPLLGGKCISCHSYSIKSALGDETEDSMLNICQLVWECWGEDTNSPMQYGMLLFDLDQWYKDQMPSTYHLESNTFMATNWCTELAGRGSVTLHARIDPDSVCPYSHANRLEEHFYPNSLQYNCICLNTSEALTLRTVGVQRSIISSLESAGSAALLRPGRVYAAAVKAGLASAHVLAVREEDQRRYLLNVALEARLSRFLKRCAHDWATGSHAGVGCTLPFLVDWAWKRALELKENAKEFTAPLFISSSLPDGNVIRCLDHCVQQLTQLTGLMDAVITKCCNLVVPDALSEMEEVHVGIGCVSLYFQVVQWFLRVGLLPERSGPLPYPQSHLSNTLHKRRMKLNRLQETSNPDEDANKSCALLYIDQLIEYEFGGEKIHQMWIKAGSDNGLYPPPSLYSLLRLYLMPEIPEEHKHSLVLYLLLDYSKVYDEIRYEEIIRRLMQFPTMFGLSNTAIKATQAFWHLDHRDFDFALDQLQCLTGNTLSEWQHNVVLSALLAQKKTQAALQYLHVRKPPPVQNNNNDDQYNNRITDQDNLSEWQSCTSLYLSRGLVHSALDVTRECVKNAYTATEKTQALQYFFKGCRNTGNLSKVLQLTLSPFEEDTFIKYLENCNEPQTSDLLIMFYLQQARYLEAERYNKKLIRSKPKRNKDSNTSMESVFDVCDREGARDALVDVVCSALPSIANTVAHCASKWNEIEPHVMNAPQPLSVFVQTQSPKNTFTYKSSFIQDTIENASETWMNKPKMRKGLKRALEIEETPFICTPKVIRTKSIFSDQVSESTPSKRPRLSYSNTPKTPKVNSFRVSEKLSKQMEELLNMPEIQSPVRVYGDRAETPHSILKIRRNECDGAVSPADSRYLGDSDDEILETASCHTHYSDSTNKHLRFTIPTSSETGSTPSPLVGETQAEASEKDGNIPVAVREKETDISTDSYVTTTSHAMNENQQLGAQSNPKSRRSYKDSVRARASLSISANSSLSEDPNTSIESIADIPVTLINPRYTRERNRNTPSPLSQDEKDLNLERSRRQSRSTSRIKDSVVKPNLFQSFDSKDDSQEEKVLTLSRTEIKELDQPNYSVEDLEPKQRFSLSSAKETDRLEVPKTPQGRRGIRSVGESTPIIRSRSHTPEKQDSPTVTPLRGNRMTRSRSRSKTPDLSPRSSPLAPIIEQPAQEKESESQEQTKVLRAPRQLRSRSKTPERMEMAVSESPKLEVITESPTKSSESPLSSPTRRSLRSRSRTPDPEIVPEPVVSSPRMLRSRSKTPEKLMSPKKEQNVRTRKSLSRIVLEQNTFAKTKQTLESLETEITESRSEAAIECTPMKPLKTPPSLMDVTLSPINKPPSTEAKTENSVPAFILHETYFEKSVLKSYQSSVADEATKSSQDIPLTEKTVESSKILTPFGFPSINETDFNKSVLHSYESSVAESDHSQEAEKSKPAEKVPKPFAAFASMIETDFEKSVLKSHESSGASPEQSKEVENVNISSLITNDSDSEIRETEYDSQSAEMKQKETSVERESAVMKEKEKIVEIEREINELEEGMSEDSQRESNDSESTEESSSEGETEASGEISTPESDSEVENNEVISIVDSDSNESITLNINTDTDTNNTDNAKDSDEVDIEGIEHQENLIEAERKANAEKPEHKEQGAEIVSEIIQPEVTKGIDPLEGASLLTDDNSDMGQSMVLNYSAEQEQNDQQLEVEKDAASLKDESDKIATSPNVDVIDASSLTAGKIESMGIVTEKSQEEAIVAVESIITTKDSEMKQSDAVVEETVESDINLDNTEKPAIRTRKRSRSTTSNKSSTETEISEKSKEAETNVLPVIQEIKEQEPKVHMTRKRSNSSVSVKSTTEQDVNVAEGESNVSEHAEIQNVKVPSTPSRRKRANSNASVKSASEKDNNTAKEVEAIDTGSNTIEQDEKQQTEESQTPARRKRANSNASIKSTTQKDTKAAKEIETKDSGSNVSERDEEQTVEEPRTPVRRKRANSNASAKSVNLKEKTATNEGETIDSARDEEQTVEETKTPAKRKRANSNASRTEEMTPEATPSRRRAKTPTSEGRTIITRRVSREIGLLEKSNESVDDSVSLTPKRRATRARSKDDSESVKSDVSVASTKSKTEDMEVKSVRKGRKSLLPTKPDLSVIPEVIAEESKDEMSVPVLSSTRRRTRILSTEAASPRGRRASTASRASESTVNSEDDRDIDVETIDRISLLYKTEFEGPPDADELHTLTQDTVDEQPKRLSRAASESRGAPRAARIGRRVASVDVVESSAVSPLAGAESPARGRRASFNRAVEAITTPKGRRKSTDVQSPAASPAAPESEARRTRRSSTQSNPSLTKPETGRRSKKMPLLEEEDK